MGFKNQGARWPVMLRYFQEEGLAPVQQIDELKIQSHIELAIAIVRLKQCSHFM